MGDFSRDTFRLTNLLHNLVTGETTTNPRHYVAVRTQQGVPVLDADLNESADIARMSAEAQLRDFFGDGIPSGDNGFRIGPVTADNDFSIAVGVALVSGKLVVNPHAALTYIGQTAALEVEVADISPPLAGTRTDLVYLDVWEEEVGASADPRPDDRLVDPSVGVETCTRMERRWAVRVAAGASSLGAVPTEPGHAYMALARIRRSEMEGRILASRITDARRTGLTVAEHLRVPVHATLGLVVVDSNGVADRVDALRGILMDRFEGDLLFIAAAVDPGLTLLRFALQHVLHLCVSAALQARTRNLDNAGALAVFGTLVAAQRSLVEAIADHGDPGPDRDAFVSGYAARLNAVESAVDGEDLVGAYEAQIALNAWLSSVVDTLPEGIATVHFIGVSPEEALDAGEEYVFTLQVTSHATSSGSSEEVFDVTATLSSDLWSVDPPAREITLANEGGTGTVEFTVTPHAGNAESGFVVVAAARANPTLVRSSHPGVTLRLGEIPPIFSILSYAGAPLNIDEQLELTVSQITFALGGAPVNFSLRNRTDLPRTYGLEWFVTLPPGEDETGWTPLESAPQSNSFPVGPEGEAIADLRIRAPAGTEPDTTATIHVHLVSIDGETLSLDDQEVVTVEVLVIANPE